MNVVAKQKLTVRLNEVFTTEALSLKVYVFIFGTHENQSQFFVCQGSIFSRKRHFCQS